MGVGQGIRRGHRPSAVRPSRSPPTAGLAAESESLPSNHIITRSSDYMSSPHPEPNSVSDSRDGRLSLSPSPTSTSHPTAQLAVHGAAHPPSHLPKHLAHHQHHHGDDSDDGPAFTPLTGSSLRPQPSRPQPPPKPTVDIEHTTVENDPREWSDRKKMTVLVMVSCGSIIPTLGAVSVPASGRGEDKLSKEGGRDRMSSLSFSACDLLRPARTRPVTSSTRYILPSHVG